MLAFINNLKTVYLETAFSKFCFCFAPQILNKNLFFHQSFKKGLAVALFYYLGATVNIQFLKKSTLRSLFPNTKKPVTIN